MPDDEKPAEKPFEGEFDAERAARLIENLRADLAKIKTERDEARTALQEKADAEKTEAQKLQDRLAAAEETAKKTGRALLIERATRKHSLPDDVVEFLTGDTEEEIEAKAQRLAALGSPKKDESKEEPGSGLPEKPKADLVPGHGGDDAETFDPDAIAAAARR